MALQSQIVTYEADQLSLVSHYYFDASISGRRPAILVFPEAFGLGEHAKSRAKRLAGLGYAALACDLHGQGKLLQDLNEVMALLGPLQASPLRVRARARAALDALASRSEVISSKVAAIGYCFGGTMALES